MLKNLALFSVLIAILILAFSNFGATDSGRQELTYSEFLKKVKDDSINKVEIEQQIIRGEEEDGTRFSTYMPIPDQYLMSDLIKNGVDVKGKPPEQQSLLMRIFISWFPILFIIGVWLFFMRQMQGGGVGGRGAMSFGRSRARMIAQDQINTRFDDVAGVDEAKEEVSEIVDFLRSPQKFQRLGGKIPRGVLLVGSPGTGKTLLGKAVAGEAGVPFFSISGSDFVEMFVGVGASRVRDLFEQAKKCSPCVIFIDEIDAIGRHRGAGAGGGNDEREQTLNQLLVEMDGFAGNEGVIVLAATNRPDVLDKALLRPGRFDRQVTVPLPDIRGREKILSVHMRKVPLAKDVDEKVIARGTPGFSGADLANLVNEAALISARTGKRKVSQAQLELAKDKILMGAERRSMIMSEEEKRLTAYHEAGHAIVGRVLAPNHDPVYKVSIIPRGRALGVTMFLPEEDQHSRSLVQLESQLASLYGGRLAEEIIFGASKVTTGASNDIERATELARAMVIEWGLSSIGPINYQDKENQIVKLISEDKMMAIDLEVKRIIDTHYQKADSILRENIDILHAMADALMDYETLDTNQIDDLMNRKKPKPPKGWKSSTPESEQRSSNQDDRIVGDEQAEPET